MFTAIALSLLPIALAANIGDFECIDDTKFKQFTSATSFIVQSCPPGFCATRNPPFKNPCIGKQRAAEIDGKAEQAAQVATNAGTALPGAYLDVLIFRLYRLYFIMELRTTATGYYFWGPVLGFMAAPVILGITAIASYGNLISATPLVVPPSTEPLCKWGSNAFLYLCYSSVLIQLVFLYYLNYRLSGIRSAFNEFKETQVSLIASTVFFVVDVALVMSGACSYDWGNWLVWICNIGASNMLIWSVIGKPIYGYFFRYEQYLAEWRQGTKDKAFQTGTGTTTTVLSSSKDLGSGPSKK
ncbi:hypothetical protein HDV03_003223 [Kappamyces sp. JEL0829]|nr:hypothetical protein HDV03_003223 [Kappamyces sp. JEL0829]